MLERALLWALIALAIVSALSALTTGFDRIEARVTCAFQQADICLLDDAEDPQ